MTLSARQSTSSQVGSAPTTNHQFEAQPGGIASPFPSGLGFFIVKERTMLLSEMICDGCELRLVEFDLDEYDPDEPMFCDECADFMRIWMNRNH